MRQLLILCVFICCTGLLAQTYVSQVNYVTTTNMTQAYSYFAGQSDGSLCYFTTEVDTFLITVNRGFCTLDGTIQPAIPVIISDDQVAWSDQTPVTVDYETKYGSVYVMVTTLTQVIIFVIPDIAMNTIPTVHIFDVDFTGETRIFGPNAIYGTRANPDIMWTDDVIKLDLTTDTISTVITATQEGCDYGFALLGDDYLLVYEPYLNEGGSYRRINAQGGVVELTLTGINMIADITDSYPDIGGGYYFANISDGLIRTNGCGFIHFAGNQFLFYCTGIIYNEFSIPCYSQDSIMPLGNSRFICRETYNFTDTDPYFITYNRTDSTLVEDTAFPNLHIAEYDNPSRLLRMNDRYIIGVSKPTVNQRRFACVDEERQTVRSSTYTVTEGDYYSYCAANKLYYVRDNVITIYSVDDVVGNDDEVVIPAQLTARVSPNPFASKVKITLSNVETSTDLQIRIYNLKGQRVRVLDSAQKTGTEDVFEWDGYDQKGTPLPAGVYLYQVKSAGKVLSGKIIRVR